MLDHYTTGLQICNKTSFKLLTLAFRNFAVALLF